MPLRLEVVSAHRESMGGAYIQEFAACGGTIGRSLACDWPLPDSKRYISSRHAMIDYQGGAYYLVDLSRNGTYINDNDAPVGTGNPQRIFTGDKIKLGEFELAVAITEADEDSVSDNMRDSIVRGDMVAEDESMELTMLPANKIREDSVLDDVLRPSDESGELSALRELPPNSKAAAHYDVSLSATADDFLRSAGLNPDDFRGIEPDILLKNAARLLSEFTEGTHALLSAKQQIMSGLHIKDGSSNGATNPLQHSDGIDNAMRLMLAGGSDVHLSGPQAVEAAFEELLGHQRAVVAAMQKALGDFIENFEPESIERIFDEQRVRSGTSKSRQAFLEAYTQAFAWLEHRNKHKVPRRFDEEFAKAYVLETKT